MNKAEELKQKAKNSWMDKREFKYVFNEEELQQYADEVSRESRPVTSITITPNCIKTHGGENEAFEAAMKELHKRYILFALGTKPAAFIFELHIKEQEEQL